ncbi:hypothetical protein DE146DRAFT_645913 [Phaeosphaeria sp. MPI-PUGE-AT-0046c]|nr:hypothetical protein DE146DRAFT_645913 [Phaeosphaeria sp. MPI-PUGE-AT-0046c]
MASTMFDSAQTLFQQLEQAKQNFRINNAHLSEEELQGLWSHAAFQSSNASMAQQTPRSLPSTDMMNLPMSTDFNAIDRTLSAPAMSRTASASTSWQPTNDYTFYSDASTRQHLLHSIPEVTPFSHESMTEWSPQDYVTNYIEPASSTRPTSLPLHTQQLHVPLTPSLQWSSSTDGSTASSSPSPALMTPITQASSFMSRQSSCGSQFLDDTSMLRIQSESSCILPILPEEDGVPFFSFDDQSKPVSACVDTSQFPSSSVGFANGDFFSPSQSISASASSQAFASSENMPGLAEDMRRSASATSSEGNTSDGSAPASTCSRQLRREREIISQAAARKIAPKAFELDETESAPSHASMAKIRSEDGSSKTVGVITKTPYVRPSHPKIMCQFCSERPEGFRGTHELDRHIARAHASRRKAYICVDASPDKKFLASCKHCRNKKVYGAYYNAAAHLRRAHFHPRKRGRKGKSDEKRGGIGGGDDPPMDFLKQHWIKEVEVEKSATTSSPASAADEAPEPIDTPYDLSNDVDTHAPFPSQQSLPASMNAQVQMDPSHYNDGYGLNMHASESMYESNNTFDTNSFAAYDPNVAGMNDASSFQFDAYMS